MKKYYANETLIRLLYYFNYLYLLREMGSFSFMSTLSTPYSKISYFDFKILNMKMKLPRYLAYLFPCKMFFIIFLREQNHPVSSEFEVKVILKNKVELFFCCRFYP